MQAALATQPGLTILAAAIEDLWVEDGRVAGVVTAEGERYLRQAGRGPDHRQPFLQGGDPSRRVAHSPPAGTREQPAIGLSDRLYGLDFAMGRLKTGTPARLDGRTIAWDRLERQEGDAEPTPFSFLTERWSISRRSPAASLWLPRTRKPTGSSPSASAEFGGLLRQTGRSRRRPTLLPVDRGQRSSASPTRTSHPGLPGAGRGPDDDTVYPNGVSTSVSEETQRPVPAHHRGAGAGRSSPLRLRHRRIRLCGSARACRRRWKPSACRGLYLAGQINGSLAGYEEAAARGPDGRAQRRARAAGGLGRRHLARNQAYIGVMIDDLTTGVTEPYRMFTTAGPSSRLSAACRQRRSAPRPPIGRGLGLGGTPSGPRIFAANWTAVEAARGGGASVWSMTPAEAMNLGGSHVNADGQAARPGHAPAPIATVSPRRSWPRPGRRSPGTWSPAVRETRSRLERPISTPAISTTARRRTWKAFHAETRPCAARGTWTTAALAGFPTRCAKSSALSGL